MERELKEGWFVRGSIGETLRNILVTVDPVYVKTVPPAEFEKQHIDEVRFFAPYDKKEIQEVEQYIHQHLAELYQFVQVLAQQEQSV